jgi:hypothetical protein
LHAKPQAPAAQVAVLFAGGTHALPHAPQWATLVAVLTSQPLPARPSQLPKPALQLATPQRPALHAGVALAGAQAIPQPPQWATALVVLVSQPLAALASQLPKPALQAPSEQAAARQTPAALA